MSSKENKTWKIIDLLKWGEEFLKKRGIKNSRKETEWLLAHTLKCNRIDLYLEFDKIITKNPLKTFKSYILRRLNNEPFQYIIKKGSFYGRDFIVNQNVLIPRPETETIIDLLKKKPKTRHLLDIGTGSGCIAITVYLEKLAKNILAIDNSEAALNIATINAKEMGANNIQFLKMNILSELPHKKFDVIVSNPPYIPKKEIQSLQREIKNFEPIDSITDNKDGLTFFRRFEKEMKNILYKDGIMLLEFGGMLQIDSIKSIFTSKNYNLLIHNDIYSAPRIAEITTKNN